MASRVGAARNFCIHAKIAAALLGSPGILPLTLVRSPRRMTPSTPHRHIFPKARARRSSLTCVVPRPCSILTLRVASLAQDYGLSFVTLSLSKDGAYV
jgi:hypothetical protein